MILPPFLKPGDKVGIISSGNFTVKKYIDKLVRILQDWGLQPVLGKTIGPREGSFAGPDKLRRQDLQEMLDNDEVRAILETMGGYGLLRVIDDIDFNKFKYNPKWLVGYADTTLLHAHVQSLFSTTSIHATMAADLEAGFREENWETLRKALFGEKLEYRLSPHKLNRKGKAIGTLAGGTISILSNAKGTLSEVNTNGRILFLEDAGEHYSRLDSYLMSLKGAGKFKYVKGLVVGELKDLQKDDPPFGKTGEEIIREAVKEYDFPVCFGFPAGHGKENRALLFGAPAELRVTRDGATLRFK